MSWSRSLVAALVLSLVCVAGTAAASEASDHHRAGVAYAKNGKWEEAVREFDEAYRLDPSPLRLYDVAQVCLQAKQFVRARDAFAKIVDNPALTPEQQQRARAGLGTAKANVGRVHVVVADPRSSDVVSIDGARLRADVADVDPGRHVVALARDGETTEANVEVTAGGDASVTLGEKALVERKPATSEPLPTLPVEPRSSGTPVLGWVFGGVAVAALGSGIPLTVIGRSEYADIQDDPCARDQTCGGRDRGPRQMALAGEILIGVGVVSAAAAIYFFLTGGAKGR